MSAQRITLDEMVEEASQYGKFRLSQFDDGTWMAMVVLPTKPGVNVRLESGFRHKTPQSAVKKLLEELHGCGVIESVQIARQLR